MEHVELKLGVVEGSEAPAIGEFDDGDVLAGEAPRWYSHDTAPSLPTPLALQPGHTVRVC